MKSPKPPDPYTTAAAQAGANVDATVAGSIANNMNEVSPYGTVDYERAGVETIIGVDGKPMEVPRFTRTVTLDPAQQQMLNQQNQLGIGLNDLAIGQTDRLSNVLNQPIDTSGVVDFRNVNADADYQQSRRDVEQALLSRLNDQYSQDRQSLEAQLAAQGVTRNSEAWNRGIDEVNRRMEDARISAVLGAGQEQSRLAALDQSMSAANNQTRAQQIQEALALRNQPINEIGALMNGGQVTLPQFSSPFQQGVAPAPIADLISQNYAQRSQNANAFNQGLFSLLGTGMSAGASYFGG